MGPTEIFQNGRQIQDGDHIFHYVLTLINITHTIVHRTL